MPIYEYQAVNTKKGCEICHAGFEYIQAIDEKPLSHCLTCGHRVKRVISWCHAAVIDPSPEHVRVERRITEYEKAGLYSHAAELADKHSHKINDKRLKERALEDYKKAGYSLESPLNSDTS
jgi:putative FmdB family regulatory protein